MFYRVCTFLAIALLSMSAYAQGSVDELRSNSDAAQDQWNAVSGPKHVAPVDTTRAYSINDVEQLPEFPGGPEAMSTFIADNFRYTDTTRTSAPGGRIYVQFVVERNGRVGRVRVVRGLSAALNAEAERVVGAMPPWTPAKYFGGTPVACRMVLPIKCHPK